MSKVMERVSPAPLDWLRREKEFHHRLEEIVTLLLWNQRDQAYRWDWVGSPKEKISWDKWWTNSPCREAQLFVPWLWFLFPSLPAGHPVSEHLFHPSSRLLQPKHYNKPNMNSNTCNLQQSVCQSTLSVIHMSHDSEIPYLVRSVCRYVSELRWIIVDKRREIPTPPLPSAA